MTKSVDVNKETVIKEILTDTIVFNEKPYTVLTKKSQAVFSENFTDFLKARWSQYNQ